MSSAEENLGMIMFRWPNVPFVPWVPGALKRYAGSWKYRDSWAERGLSLPCVLWPLRTLHQLSHESGLSWDGLKRKLASCKRDFCFSQQSITSKLRFSRKEQMLAEDNHPGGSRHRKSRCEDPTMGMQPGEGWGTKPCRSKELWKSIGPTSSGRL